MGLKKHTNEQQQNYKEKIDKNNKVKKEQTRHIKKINKTK